MKLEIASNEVESMIRADECTFLIMYVLWIKMVSSKPTSSNGFKDYILVCI